VSAGSESGYALFIRGINVGAKNSLPMADLRAMLSKLACLEVQTYVQSGNAVFQTKIGLSELTKKIEEALARYMGRPIDITLRTQKQMKGVIAANPFESIATNPSNLCVTFLSLAPSRAQVAPLQARDFKDEQFHVAGKEIYTGHPNGQGQSALREALWRLPLRGAITTRNWNTVLKVTGLLEGQGAR
jgi:uncharacterized protein (DUF1697 family)